MISAWWLLLIVPFSGFLGMFLAALMLAGSEIEQRDEERLDEK